MRLLSFFSVVSALSLPCSALFAIEEGASADGVAPASDEGLNAIKSFKFDEGLQCQLWAAEPLLANPVCFTQDEKGHWYVAETFRLHKGAEDDREHPEWRDEDIAADSVADRLAYMHKHVPDTAQFTQKFATAQDRIRRLEDTTGSGIANRSTIFADGFRAAEDGVGAGLLARGNEVWYTNIPTLWHFRDTKDTGTADVKENLLTGFGVHFALIGHDLHGLRFGPDGKIYFSIGDRALRVKTKEGKEIAQTQSGSIMRCNPDGSEFEIFTTGVRNPQDLVFNERGDLFTGDNNSDAGDKVRFTYLVEGGDCGWRMAFQYLPDRGPWMRERPWDEKIAPSVRYIVPCILNVGNGPSGLSYNPGTGLSPKYYGNFYLSDFRGGAASSVVHEIHLEPKGAFYTGTHRDWVKGILTTDVQFGNDGGLYVLDWVASWGGVGKGRIYKFTDPTAETSLQKETEKLIYDGMSKRPNEELAKLLGHQDMRVRQAAQFELAGRGASAIKIFAGVALDSRAAKPLARLHAIWGLGQLGKKPGALDALPALLGDADAEVRAQAAKVLGNYKVGAVSGKLIALLQDPDNRVRFFSAISLGKIGDQAAFAPLCAMLVANDDRDPILRHGGVMGLVGCGTVEQIAAKVQDPSVALRGAAVVALRRLESPRVADFLKDGDESIVLEAARAIHDVPIQAALPALAELTANPAIKNPHILDRAVNANYRLGKLENATALAALAADARRPEAARKDALTALTIWAHPDGKDRLLNQWRPIADRGDEAAAAAITQSAPALFKDAPASIQETLAKLAGKLALKSVAGPLASLATNEKTASGTRVEAIKALAAFQDAHVGEIAEQAIHDRNVQVRAEGLLALAGADPANAVKAIGTVLENGSVADKQGALTALTLVQGPGAVALLAAQLDKLIAHQLPPEIELDVIDAATARDDAGLKNRLAQYQAAWPAKDDLAKWRVALAGGSAERGRKTFREKAETSCLRCHKCEGAGDSIVGPDLTHIGSKKNREYLLESIVYPDKQIAEGYEIAVLTLQDGSVVAGRLVSHSEKELKIETTDEKGKTKIEVVPVAQVKTRTRAPSPMPPNLLDFLSKSELRDLVEYLATRK
jgi:quinoprotein glucose dehydrogenase